MRPVLITAPANVEGGLAWGFNTTGRTDHYSTRAEITAARDVAEDGNGYARLDRVTLSEDQIVTLLDVLEGNDARIGERA